MAISLNNCFGKELQRRIIRRFKEVKSYEQLENNANVCLFAIYQLLDYMQKESASIKELRDNVLVRAGSSIVDNTLERLVRAEVLFLQDGGVRKTTDKRKVAVRIYTLTEEGRIFKEGFIERVKNFADYR